MFHKPDFWMDSAAPVGPEAAYVVEVSLKVVPMLADCHDIQLGLASHLIRPMVADLISTGSWRYQMSRQQYRLIEGDCHAFVWLRHGSSEGQIIAYYARHPDNECPVRETEPAVPPGDLWMPHYAETVPPPRASGNPWRAALRTGAELPVTILKPALQYYAQYGPRTEMLGPGNFATAYLEMAREAIHVHRQWHGKGDAYITDSTGLIWRLVPPGPHSSKPQVTAVLPPRGKPADKPTDQRASRRPDSAAGYKGGIRRAT
ncbi:hypothetical protein ACFWNG_23180 [Streptomyces sp. NPDC058391]|uniref:hypothetical protein n=1 Tax=Streptomyces sp. NPDC058391 TaxID=3346476 RepID=UPI00364D0D8E